MNGFIKRNKSVSVKMLLISLLCLAMTGASAHTWGFAQPERAYAAPYTVPALMITEVTPDSLKIDGTSGTPDAFEFIELYNTTDSAINLKNYRIIYETPTVYNWIIATDKIIPAKGTFIMWVKSVDTATLAQFNHNYGSSLTAAQVYEQSASGLANTASRTLSIANPSNVKISTVSYTASDVVENNGIQYLYPINGSNVMRKFGSSDPASPGTVFPGQVPPSAWDSVAPAAPGGLAAVPGSNNVTLSWNANSESDLAFYRVYRDGTLFRTIRSGAASLTVTGLTEEQLYSFQVSAVDTSNNESPRSAAVAAAPLSVALTQQFIISPPSGSFPEYNQWLELRTPGPYIPGIQQGLVPQGMTYAPDQDWILLSHYRSDGKSSMISILNGATGQLLKSVTLYYADGTPYIGHAGGIAVSQSNVWISSGGYLHRIPLQDIVDAPNRTPVTIADRFHTGTRGSFAMYADGMLWAGEFYAPGYAVDPSHQRTARDGVTHYAWMTGFALDPVTDLLPSGKFVDESTPVTPDAILSIPDRIQGAATLSDGRIALSQSFGRTNDSKLQFYQDVMQQAPHASVTVNGTSVPLRYLDGNSRQWQLNAPPLSEGIIEKDNKLLVLFESAHPNYVPNGKYPVDRIASVDVVPPLMVTEITPDSRKVDGTSGTPDAFEFIEIYNHTNETINLNNYRIIYETPTVYTWTINTNKYVPAKGTFIIWVSSVSEATLAQFNQNYGVSLNESQVFRVSASGLANTAARTVSIAGPGNVKISTAHYAAADVAEDQGIQYAYPVNGSKTMRKLTTSAASPGSISANQAP